MASQIPLDLGWRHSTGAGDFIVGDANAEAVAWIDRWPDWPAHAFLLTGAAGTGKTHLARVWQQRAAAGWDAAGQGLDTVVGTMVLDDADQWAAKHQTELFHLLNRAREERFSLLLCAAMPVDAWGVTLPDLSSRLKALPVAKLHEPDDALLAALFTKALSERGIAVKPDVLDYLFPRLPRDAAALVHFAERLDRYALQTGQKLSLATARAFAAGCAEDA